VSAITAIAIHVAFEKPILRYLRRAYLPEERAAAIERSPAAVPSLSGEVAG
jgi:hypothetical protein